MVKNHRTSQNFISKFISFSLDISDMMKQVYGIIRSIGICFVIGGRRTEGSLMLNSSPSMGTTPLVLHDVMRLLYSFVPLIRPSKECFTSIFYEAVIMLSNMSYFKAVFRVFPARDFLKHLYIFLCHLSDD